MASALNQRKFFALFVYLLLVLVFYPFVKEGTSSDFAIRVVGAVGILLTVYAITPQRTLLVLGTLLAIPAVLRRVLLFHPNSGSVSLFAIVLSFAFDVYVVVIIFRRVFTKDQPTSEAIFGALCIYLLVGFSFTSVYELIYTFNPRAFYLDPLTNLHTVPTRFDFLYYSFATITSVGAVGITAVSAEARAVAMIEAILGVLYLAVFIARLVSAYRHPSMLGRN
jgi:hypothetical protein